MRYSLKKLKHYTRTSISTRINLFSNFLPIKRRSQVHFFRQKVRGGNYLPQRERIFQAFIDGDGEFEAQKLLHAIQKDTEQRLVALNIGASVGIMTRLLAQNYEFVISVEPIPQARACILRNLDPNMNNVLVLPFAISKQQGSRLFYVDNKAIGGSSSFTSHISKYDSTVTVNSITLDQVQPLAFGRRIGFIKIDVQGSELEVLESGYSIFTQHRPVCLIEMKSKLHDFSEKIESLFEELNYQKVREIGKDAIFTPKPYLMRPK